MATNSEFTKNSLKEDSQETSAEDDLQLLLECLPYQKNSPSAQKQVLTTIATMCSNSNSTRNFFHSTGGLSYVCELLFEPQSPEVQQAALYALGCATEKNHVNQLKLCTEHLFSFLASLLVIPPASTYTLPVAVAYLSGCLMSHNVQAQRLTKDTGLLSKLISLFKYALPSPVSSDNDSPQPVSNQELWSSVSSALCAATNNPQNETNQCECIRLFPAALSVLSAKPLNETVVRLSISFIASCTANNKGAQDRLRLVGGLKALVAILSTIIQTMDSTGQSSELLLHIVKTLSAAALDHRINCETLIELECIELLLHLLQFPDLSVSTQLNVIVCLGMLAEENEVGQSKVAKSEGVCLLVDVLAHSQNEELNKATTFLLQCCVERGHLSSPPESALLERAAHIDQLLAQEAKESTKSGSSIKDVLDKLSKSKLPAKDLVKTWLSNCMHSTESSSQPDEEDKTCDQAKTHSTLKSSSEQQSHTLQVLMENKERLEALLKEERTEKEKLKQELLSHKQTAMSQAKETQAMSQEIRKVTSNTKVKATTKKNVRYSSNSTRTSNKQATQPNLISKISQLQLSHKMSKEVPQTNQHTDVDCSHQCIGCRPRLKCPIVNSRNLIKLLLTDHYTCLYHRKIAFKLKKDTKKASSPHASHSHKSMSPHLHVPDTQTSLRVHTYPSLMYMSPPQLRMSPPNPCTASSPVKSVDSTISVGQETPFDCTTLSNTRNSDSDYLPSPFSHDDDTTSIQPQYTHCYHNSAQIQRGFNPQTYRLLPRTCGPSQKLRPRPKVLADVSNKPARKTQPNSLSVFDYSSPGTRPHSTTHNVVNSMKTARPRAKAVPWSHQEESFLKEGVQLIGTGQWRHILAAYPFHPSRDSSSLRVKYKNMMA